MIEKKVGRYISLRMGIAMSITMSIVGALLGALTAVKQSGAPFIMAFLPAFLVSLVITMILAIGIGFIVPMNDFRFIFVSLWRENSPGANCPYKEMFCDK